MRSRAYLEGLVLASKGIENALNVRRGSHLPLEERGPEELGEYHGAEVLVDGSGPAAALGRGQGPDVAGDPPGVRHVLEHDLAVPQAVGPEPQLEQL